MRCSPHPPGFSRSNLQKKKKKRKKEKEKGTLQFQLSRTLLLLLLLLLRRVFPSLQLRKKILNPARPFFSLTNIRKKKMKSWTYPASPTLEQNQEPPTVPPHHSPTFSTLPPHFPPTFPTFSPHHSPTNKSNTPK